MTASGPGWRRSTRSTTTCGRRSTGRSPTATPRPRSTIAGGASWPHWLRGTIHEGRRWLDDAFSCDGEATETTRALALTGRGLIEFLAGHPERSDDDLETAIEIFERQGDVAGLALAHSFYAELAAVIGDPDEARRRRMALRDLYGRTPDDPFAAAARSYSLAKLAMLDGDLVEAEHHYRAATDGFGRLDRPVMSSICLGMVADFDERAGDFTRRDRHARSRHRDQRGAHRRVHGSAPGSPRLGAAARRSAGSGRDRVPTCPRLSPSGAAPHGDAPRPRRHRRRCTGCAAATTPPGRRRRRGWRSTGPAGRAASGTASTSRPTCRSPRPCAATCWPRSPPMRTIRSKRPNGSPRATPSGPRRAPTSRRSSAPMSTGPGRMMLAIRP